MTLRRTAVALVLLALVAVACGRDAAEPAPVPSLPASPTELPASDFAGFVGLLRSLKGTPVVVNVWASWCGPCRDEAAALAEAARRHEGEVQFLGVDVLDTRPDARAFIDGFGWTYPSLFDQDAEIRDRLGLLGQPVTQFYDAEGNLIDQHSGAISTDQLEEQISAILGPDGGSESAS